MWGGMEGGIKIKKTKEAEKIMPPEEKTYFSTRSGSWSRGTVLTNCARCG